MDIVLYGAEPHSHAGLGLIPTYRRTVFLHHQWLNIVDSAHMTIFGDATITPPTHSHNVHSILVLEALFQRFYILYILYMPYFADSAFNNIV